MLIRELIIEELLKIVTLGIPNKELRHKIRDGVVKKIKDREKSIGFDKPVYMGEEVSEIIYNELSKNKPCLICRYGINEFNTMRNYVVEGGLFFPRGIRKPMSEAAGFFPATQKNMRRFGKEIHSFAKDIDILGVVGIENLYCRKYISESTILVGLNEVYSVYNKNPWTQYLKGKKVLVVYPLEEKIKSQYEKRELLFKNPDILPEFELITYKPVQSIADEKYDLPYKDWFEALDKMKEDISKIDFDIALIGAGAYGIFLAHHCKMIGKQAVHLGGQTQLLFGIRGYRWDTYAPEWYCNANLEHWIYPDSTDKPKGYEKVEDGCYW